jgi:hypothetical protein
MEIGVQGWGNALLTFDQASTDIAYIQKDVKPGVFVWANFSTAAAGLPIAQDILKMTKQAKVPASQL